MNELQEEIKAWANAAFGFRGLPSIISSLNHLGEEIDELKEAICSGNIDHISEEYADCFIILLHIASNCGLTFSDIERSIRHK